MVCSVHPHHGVYLERVPGVNAPAARSVTRPPGGSEPDQPGCYCWLHAIQRTSHSPAGQKMSHRESLQLLDLPWDDVVFQHIFPYLNVEDLCCLREVSKGFQKLFIDYMSTCKKLDLSDCTMTNQYFQKSDLQHISTANSSDVDIQTLEQFFCKFSRLKVVELDKMELLTDVGLHHLATNCTHIETLSVAGCWKLTDSGLKKVVNHCLKLKLLNIQNCPRVTEKYLCSLCVRGIHVISSCSVAYMVKRRKQVNYLGINIQI
ncbi:F-box/LRR-repeat protein 15 isoform X7 [Cherax quadricarinatus]|uniref:F-box/LRR-repeat protein 15 isoform X7 n=1 Tax=Cherax quadricarinatus TaxID=27406 RepID=UPI002377F08D|nr:F-box/LRR-repeat protein 15-like isoform X3 [Cherax quadricarinatus]